MFGCREKSNKHFSLYEIFFAHIDSTYTYSSFRIFKSVGMVWVRGYTHIWLTNGFVSLDFLN